MIAYQRGLTDYLNVLNAQTLLFRQQQVEQQVQAARLSAHAELVTALGGGSMPATMYRHPPRSSRAKPRRHLPCSITE